METSITPKTGPSPRPVIISRDDFVWLMTLAYRRDPLRGVARQMSEALNVSEKTCERWLSYEQTPPPRVIEAALPLALDHMDALEAVTQRVEASLK